MGRFTFRQPVDDTTIHLDANAWLGAIGKKLPVTLPGGRILPGILVQVTRHDNPVDNEHWLSFTIDVPGMKFPPSPFSASISES
jgi:hypothetical protein